MWLKREISETKHEYKFAMYICIIHYNTVLLNLQDMLWILHFKIYCN